MKPEACSNGRVKNFEIALSFSTAAKKTAPARVRNEAQNSFSVKETISMFSKNLMRRAGTRGDILEATAMT